MAEAVRPPGVWWCRTPRDSPALAAAVRALGAFGLVVCKAALRTFSLIIAEDFCGGSVAMVRALPFTIVFQLGSLRGAGWISLQGSLMGVVVPRGSLLGGCTTCAVVLVVDAARLGGRACGVRGSW